MKDVRYLLFDDVGIHLIQAPNFIKPFSIQSVFKFQFEIDKQTSHLKIHIEKLDSIFGLIICSIYELQLREGIKTFREIVKQLNLYNPVGYDLKYGHPFYEMKLKEFLSLLTLERRREFWKPVIICDKNLSTVCYYAYNRIAFLSHIFEYAEISIVRKEIDKSQDYLLNVSVRFQSFIES